MGNSSRNPEDYDIVRNYRSQDWEPTSLTPSSAQLWRNRKTHQIAEIYRLYSIPSIQDMNRYEMRSTQQNFVKVYYIALSPNKAMCFKQQYVRLLIEYIPVKLQNVAGLQLQEALTILASVFKGFNTLSNNYGLIEPQQELIGFNQWGKAKIWLNKQYNNNFPAQSLPPHFDKSRAQASHVRKIFDLIQKKTQTGQLPISLKELFRLNNPSFLQAVLIAEQYAYQNLLSLQRYIRTDLYIRKSSVYASNIRQINQNREMRGASNQKSSAIYLTPTQPLLRQELKRINSVDALHTQRVLHHSQSTTSFTCMPYKQNFNHLSGVKLGRPQNVKSSIPKISFQKGVQTRIFLPFLSHPPNSFNRPLQVKLPHSKEATEHVKMISILSPPVSQTPSSERHQHIQNKDPMFVPIQVDVFSDRIQKRLEQNIKQIEKQVPKFQTEQQKIESNINMAYTTVNQEQNTPGTETCRSIIDKVESQVSQSDKQADSPRYEHHEDEQIQVSGTFNYKAVYERDNIQNFRNPLQQIGEEQDYSKQKQFDEESKAKQREESKLAEEHIQDNIKNVLQQPIQNIPINFESFAPAKLQNEFVSFAPNHMNFPTQQSIQSQEDVQTSKSFQYDQNDKKRVNTQEVKSIGQIEQNFVIQNNQAIKQEVKKAIERYQELPHLSQAKKRVSIDLYYQQNSQNPFYAHCTPVQSKFDVVIKRDSTLSNESERHQRPSAFAHLDTDQQIENYVRNKYLGNQNAYPQEVKVGRVQSQYEKHYVKEPESYDFAKKDVPKKQPTRQINRAYLRPAHNKISNIIEKPEEDFLDVNFLEKSLDKRYSADIKKALKKRQEQDQLNIAKLDEGLMKFSTSKASLTQKSSKEERYFDLIEPKNDYKNTNQYYGKWQSSTGYEYQAKTKQITSPTDNKKKKKSVRIDNIPTHEFEYQLSSSDYGKFKGFTKQSYKSPIKEPSYTSTDNYLSKFNQSSKITNQNQAKVTQLQKQNIDERYNKYVKNNQKYEKNINKIAVNTPSINQIMSIKGQSRLMLSPIPEKRWEDQGRLSYDQLRSFLWG